MPRFQPPRATRDLLPADTAVRNHVRVQFSQVVESYGFQAIQTPTFEKLELFSARSGPEIKSSMLTFHLDHEELALRPEMTAPVSAGWRCPARARRNWWARPPLGRSRTRQRWTDSRD